MQALNSNWQQVSPPVFLRTDGDADRDTFDDVHGDYDHDCVNKEDDDGYDSDDDDDDDEEDDDDDDYDEDDEEEEEKDEKKEEEEAKEMKLIVR